MVQASDSQPFLPPPTWAADPSGVHDLRYWDGSTWTEHVSDQGRAARDPLAATSVGHGDTQPSEGDIAAARALAGSPETLGRAQQILFEEATAGDANKQIAWDLLRRWIENELPHDQGEAVAVFAGVYVGLITEARLGGNFPAFLRPGREYDGLYEMNASLVRRSWQKIASMPEAQMSILSLSQVGPEQLVREQVAARMIIVLGAQFGLGLAAMERMMLEDLGPGT